MKTKRCFLFLFNLFFNKILLMYILFNNKRVLTMGCSERNSAMAFILDMFYCFSFKTNYKNLFELGDIMQLRFILQICQKLKGPMKSV